MILNEPNFQKVAEKPDWNLYLVDPGSSEWVEMKTELVKKSLVRDFRFCWNRVEKRFGENIDVGILKRFHRRIHDELKTFLEKLIIQASDE